MTVTDQAGKQRQLTYDALGRLTSVIEDPGVAPSLNYVTNYGYDALDDLISVSQGGRTFTYDSLKRLTAATNPESGTISYVYDNAGNLTSRTDARGVTTNYTYDTLNRLQTQSYTDGTPAVNYTYDNPNDYGMGLLTQVSNSNSTTTITAYDPLGRVTGSQQATGGQTYTFAYGYNLAGALKSETFPSGRVVTTVYNVINQPISVSGTSNGAATNYVTSASYAPHGAPSQVWLGNTLVHNYAYNSRLQPTSLSTSVNNSGGNTFLSFILNWGTTDNNGNLQSVDEYKGGLPVYSTWLHFTQSYSYDAVNRLSWALETSPTSCSPAANYACWFRTFQYDNRGNMWVPATGMGGIAPAATMPSSNVYTANNQIQATPYDAAGNQLVIGATAFTYDAENRQTSATNPPAYGGGTAFYRYDGNGQRVQKVMDSGITNYVYDIQGRLTAEYINFPNPTPACGTCYLTRDHLGSTRMVTDQAANLISRHDYLPFGEEITGSNVGRDSYFGRQDFVKGLFTGKERDQETGLDYFGARYFSAAQGRFTSPDPLGANILRMLNPQRWNMYAYAVNNPLAYTDPDGRDAVVANFRTLAKGAGHLGAISVHRDGSVTYADYGPRGGGKPIWGGVYQAQPLSTTLSFGSDGIASASSMAALTTELANLEGVDPSTVSLAYFKTSDSETAALDQYIDGLRRFKDSSLSWLSLYVVGLHDCAEVCNIAMSKAGIGRGSEAADIPNLLFDWLYAAQANATYSGQTGTVKKNQTREKKPDVHSTFSPCTADNPDCAGK